MNEQRLSQLLGWFSVGLGLAELLAPRKVGRAIGVERHSQYLPWVGLRELASGLGILAPERSVAGVKSRVAGDALDLGLLGAALASGTSQRNRVAIALAAVAGVTVLDVLCSRQLGANGGSNGRRAAGGTRTRERVGREHPSVRKNITISRAPEEIYAFWRNFENLPRFMGHLKSVTVSGDGRSHWVAKGPAGTEVEWDAELIEDVPNQRIAWRSLPGSMIENHGSVRFERATGGRGTVVRVELEYRPPGGAVGATVAKLLGQAPEKQIPVDLRRFKQLLETGEIARTEGQPAGRARSTSRKYDDFIRA